MDKQSNVPDIFRDPKNLATGLVFLAALAQGRQPGQSNLGAVGQSALAGLAFRGGLDQSQRRQRIQDEAISNERLEQSRQNEFRNRQISVGEQGLGLQRDQLSQAGRLAAEENASRERIAGMNKETDADRALKAAQAGYYGRMPKEGSGDGTDKSPLGGEGMQKFIQAFWEQEIKDASLANRAPDPMKLANAAAEYMKAMTSIQPGLQLVRQPDGSMAIYFPPGSDVMPGRDTSVPGQPTAMPPPDPAGVDFSTTKPAPDPETLKPIRPRRGNAPTQAFIDIQALQKISDADLNLFLKDSRVPIEQLKLIRRELQNRELRKKAQNSSSPGLR